MSAETFREGGSALSQTGLTPLTNWSPNVQGADTKFYAELKPTSSKRKLSLQVVLTPLRRVDFKAHIASSSNEQTPVDGMD